MIDDDSHGTGLPPTLKEIKRLRKALELACLALIDAEDWIGVSKEEAYRILMEKADEHG